MNLHPGGEYETDLVGSSRILQMSLTLDCLQTIGSLLKQLNINQVDIFGLLLGIIELALRQSGVAEWFERRTWDRKVLGLIPTQGRCHLCLVWEIGNFL